MMQDPHQKLSQPEHVVLLQALEDIKAGDLITVDALTGKARRFREAYRTRQLERSREPATCTGPFADGKTCPVHRIARSLEATDGPLIDEADRLTLAEMCEVPVAEVKGGTSSWGTVEPRGGQLVFVPEAPPAKRDLPWPPLSTRARTVGGSRPWWQLPVLLVATGLVSVAFLLSFLFLLAWSVQQ